MGQLRKNASSHRKRKKCVCNIYIHYKDVQAESWFFYSFIPGLPLKCEACVHMNAYLKRVKQTVLINSKLF